MVNRTFIAIYANKLSSNIEYKRVYKVYLRHTHYYFIMDLIFRTLSFHRHYYTFTIPYSISLSINLHGFLCMYLSKY